MQSMKKPSMQMIADAQADRASGRQRPGTVAAKSKPEDYDKLHPGRRLVTALPCKTSTFCRSEADLHASARFSATVLDVAGAVNSAAVHECCVFIVPQVGLSLSSGFHRREHLPTGLQRSLCAGEGVGVALCVARRTVADRWSVLEQAGDPRDVESGPQVRLDGGRACGALAAGAAARACRRPLTLRGCPNHDNAGGRRLPA